jgi:long-subunit fatty acid transport protein
MTKVERPRSNREPGERSGLHGLVVLARVVVLISALSWAQAGRAASLDVYGFSKRCLGMGNACTATADRAGALHANPANLGFLTRAVIGVDLGLTLPSFYVDQRSVTDPRYEAQLPKENLDVSVAYAAPLGSFFQRRAAIAFALLAPMLQKTRAGSEDWRSPQLPFYDTTPEMMAAMVGFGARVLDDLAVGVALSVFGRLEGTSAVSLGIAEQRVFQKHVRMDIIPVATAYAGITWRALPWLTAALSYQGALAVDYHLDIEVQIVDVGTLKYQMAGASQYVPHRLNLGLAAAWEAIDLLAAADLRVALWSLMPPLSTDVRMVLDDSSLDEDAATQTQLISLASPEVDPDSRTSWEAHAGVEYTPLGWLALRGGYLFRGTPYPRQTGATNYLDGDAHGVTLGLGLSSSSDQTRARTLLDLGAELLFMGSERVHKVDADDPTGHYRFGGWSAFLGLSLQRVF